MSDGALQGVSTELPPAIVLAGGKGTRLGMKTADTPKPLLPVAGKPFLEWISLWLIGQGVRDLTYAAGFCGDQVETWTDTWREDFGFPSSVRLECRIEDRPMGTGGAILQCLPGMDGDVLVLNGDSLLMCDLARLVQTFKSNRADAIVALFEVEDASAFGSVVSAADGRMTSFGEKRPGHGWVNGGIYILGKRFTDLFASGQTLSIEYDMFPEAIASGLTVMTYPSDAAFIDIGTPDSLALASAFVECHLAPELPRSGGAAASARRSAAEVPEAK